MLIHWYELLGRDLGGLVPRTLQTPRYAPAMRTTSASFILSIPMPLPDGAPPSSGRGHRSRWSRSRRPPFCSSPAKNLEALARELGRIKDAAETATFNERTRKAIVA